MISLDFHAYARTYVRIKFLLVLSSSSFLDLLRAEREREREGGVPA